MTLVSIIIPVFNRADLVSETIESVRAQSYRNWELILVDDWSTDSSFAVLERFSRADSRISFVRRPASMLKGANACRNYGFELSKGKYIKWVDSDDILLADALILQVEELKRNSHLQGVFAQSVFFNNGTRQLEEPWSRMIYSDRILWDHIRNNIRWHTGGILWRRSFFREKPFDESLKNSQEWFMHGQQILKLAPDQYKISDKVIYHIRRGNLRMSSSKSSGYYFHQARARIRFINGARPVALPLKYKGELCKQALIFLWHAVAKRLSGK